MRLTSTTTPGQSGPGSNGSKTVTQYFPDLQNLSVTLKLEGGGTLYRKSINL